MGRERSMQPGRPEEGRGRRDFLKLATLGAAAAPVAAVVGSGTAAAEAASEPTARGYRETEHVRKVYELARF
jgi:hypothetical protein